MGHNSQFRLTRTKLETVIVAVLLISPRESSEKGGNAKSIHNYPAFSLIKPQGFSFLFYHGGRNDNNAPYLLFAIAIVSV